jgi:hypothetical protein
MTDINDDIRELAKQAGHTEPLTDQDLRTVKQAIARHIIAAELDLNKETAQ